MWRFRDRTATCDIQKPNRPRHPWLEIVYEGVRGEGWSALRSDSDAKDTDGSQVTENLNSSRLEKLGRSVQRRRRNGSADAGPHQPAVFANCRRRCFPCSLGRWLLDRHEGDAFADNQRVDQPAVALLPAWRRVGQLHAKRSGIHGSCMFAKKT